MRAEDAQMRAMAELDEAADDGTAKELRAFHSKSEASAVESLAGARGRAESGAYLDMANASIQGMQLLVRPCFWFATPLGDRVRLPESVLFSIVMCCHSWHRGAPHCHGKVAAPQLQVLEEPRGCCTAARGRLAAKPAESAQARVLTAAQAARGRHGFGTSQSPAVISTVVLQPTTPGCVLPKQAAELAAYEAAQLSKAGLSPKKNVRGSVTFADSRVQQAKPQRSVNDKSKRAAARRQAMRSSRDSVASRLSATQSQRWSAKGHAVGTVDSNPSNRLGLASDHQRRRSVRSVRSVSSQPSVLPRRSVAGELATDQQRRRSTRFSRASQRSLDLRTQQQRRGSLTATGQSREVQRLTRKLNRHARRAANRNRRGTKFAVAVQEAVEFELDSGKLEFRAAMSPPVKAVPEESESSLRSRSSARSGGVVHNTNHGGVHLQTQQQRDGVAGSDDEDEPPPIMHPFINN